MERLEQRKEAMIKEDCQKNWNYPNHSTTEFGYSTLKSYRKLRRLTATWTMKNPVLITE